MKFDDVIKELGEFGAYQRRIYFMVCLFGTLGALHTMNGVFTLTTPDHRCYIESLDNDTYKSQGTWHDQLVNLSVPYDTDDDQYDSCDVYIRNKTTNTWSSTQQSCSKWVYDRSIFKETVISEMDLVCDDKSLRTYANMVLMGGQLGGSLVMGPLSDLIGRKKVIIIGIFCQFGVTFSTSFIKSYIPFVILFFFKTFFGTGTFLAAFVVGMEIVGPSKRKFAGIVIEMFWCMGLFMVNAMAYLIRDWKYLQLATSLPNILFFSYFWLLPESPRWLLQQGRREEASQIIKHAAKVNKVKLAEKVASLEEVVNEQSKGEKVWHMFTSCKLLVRSLVIFFNWLVASMVYYGLSLNVSQLSGDVFLNFFLSSLVEMAAYVFCIIFLDITGRRFMQCFSMVLGGASCISILFPVIFNGPDWIGIVLSLLGKFGASAGFAVIYIFSAELFPTPMRNSGMGLSSFSARIGGVLSPFIADLGEMIDGDFSVALPLLIFGGLCTTGGLLALLLPETMNKILPDTVEDAKNFGTKNAKNSYELKVTKQETLNGKENPVFVIEKTT